MALHPEFPISPHAVVDPGLRWFPADETLRETSMEKLMPPLVAQIRRKVKEFRDGGYAGASKTSRSLLNWWFREPHLMAGTGNVSGAFQYYISTGSGYFLKIRCCRTIVMTGVVGEMIFN